MNITPDAARAVIAIAAIGGRPLLVGGCVRDMIIGVESKDIDIEVHGPVTVDQVEMALRKIGRVDAVGKSFGVLKFGRDVDVSFPRRDSKTGAGHTGFSVELNLDLTLEEALSRRDFTMNSIAMDPMTHEIIDPFGGVADIKAGVIRHTSEAFADDPLRVVRAIQFSARFDFDIAPDTADLCRELAGRITELSVERLWMEWEKILTKGQKMERVLSAVRSFGLGQVFPGWTSSTVFTDELIQENPDMKGERRARMILGTQFIGNAKDLERFLKAIDAPHGLRRDAKALIAPFFPRVPDVEVLIGGVSLTDLQHRCAVIDAATRAAARQFKCVTLRDRLIVSGMGVQKKTLTWRSAERQGILDAPLKALLTGEHLKARGMVPGPVFGIILKAAMETQDRKGWTTEAEALAWLDASWEVLI